MFLLNPACVTVRCNVGRICCGEVPADGWACVAILTMHEISKHQAKPCQQRPSCKACTGFEVLTRRLGLILQMTKSALLCLPLPAYLAPTLLHRWDC